MANNRIQIKRTSVSGRAANTSTLTNAGEFALNMADGILYSSNGSAIFEIGANNTNVNITGNATIKSIVANGSVGSASQVLTSNGSSLYWSTQSGGGSSFSKSITVEAPVTNDKIVMFYTPTSITLTKMISVLTGNTSPSITFSISYGTDISTNGTQIITGGSTTTNTTTGNTITSFNNGTISSNNFVWFSVNAVSGNVNSIHVSLM